MKFKVGDVVSCLVDHPDNNSEIWAGTTGVVVAVRADGYRLGVKWDISVKSGHSCEGACEDGYGWWIDSNNVEFSSDSSAEFDIIDKSVISSFICGGDFDGQ